MLGDVLDDPRRANTKTFFIELEFGFFPDPFYIPVNQYAMFDIIRFGADLPENYEHIVHLPEKGRRERIAALKSGDILIINQPDSNLLPKEVLERLGQKEDYSFIQMALELEGNKLGYLGLMADGANQYTDEDTRLLRLLREPMSIAMWRWLAARSTGQEEFPRSADYIQIHSETG